MEFSELFSFLIILKESIQILPKIWVYVISITAISVVLPSAAFFLPFIYTEQMMNSTMVGTLDWGIKYFSIVLAAQIVFLFTYIPVSRLSGIATIIVSVTSYTCGGLSLSDLISRVKAARRRSLSASFSSSRTSSLAYVVSVIEEGYEGSHAVKKAEQLIEGQRLKALMLYMFIYISAMVGFLVFWLVFLGYKGSFNFAIYMLFFINLPSLLNICVCVMYTVFYIQCKRHCGEDIDVLGDFQYAKVPISTAC